MKRLTIVTGRILVIALAAGKLPAQEPESTNTTVFTFGGFAKSNLILTQYNNGAYSGPGRDFHIPLTIPVGDKDVNRYSDFQIKESRLFFDVSSKVGEKKLRAYAEMDFMLSAAGDERVSNSYNPRIRQFFFEYENLLVGQAWSTFMIVVLPDEIDFIGAPDGSVFIRQAQARYTLNNWQFAIENQYSTLTPYQGNGGTDRIVTENSLVPDAVIRYNMKFSKGTMGVAAIARNLHYHSGDSISDNSLGAGITTGGKFKAFGNDDIRFQLTAGTGLGRYLAVNYINDAAMDQESKLRPIPSINGYVAYLHFWNSRLSSSTSVSYFKAINDEDLVLNANAIAASLSTNIMYSPVEKLMFGGEVIWAYRELVGGTKGDFYRLQFAARYNFSFKSEMKNK